MARRLTQFLTALALVALAAACGGSGGLGTDGDKLGFDGTRAFTFNHVDGAGFSDAQLTLTLQDLAAAGRAVGANEVAARLTSTDNQYANAVLEVISLRLNQILARGSSSTGLASNFTIQLFNNSTRCRLTVTNSVGTVAVLGDAVPDDPDAGTGGGGGGGGVAGDPRLALGATTVNFAAAETTHPVAVSNAGAGTLTFSVSDDATFLAVTPASGNAPQDLTLTVDRTGLEPGVHTATVTVTSNGGTLSVQVNVTVP
ncbi:MAG: BACON domain-containing protein [Fimbriimonadaceae bacterium]|nr:BACON domain-containing protein [Fimbriimonadaceae bacterium]